MRSCILILLFVSSTFVFAQNKPVVFGFGDLPQNVLINPSFQPKSKFYLGTSFGISAGVTGVKLNDLFSKGGDFTKKVTNVISKMTSEDVLEINTQIDVLNLGYKVDNYTFLSGGFYVEADFFSTFPKDLAVLMHEGNSAYLNKSFRFDNFALRGDLLGVLHFGVSKKINEYFTLGGRFKIYSSALNGDITNSRGTFLTETGDNNLLKHHINNLYLNARGSGFYVNDELNKDAVSHVKNTFLKGNRGLGIDLGFTYNPSDNISFSASLVDIGYITYSKNIKSYKISGDYVFDGVNFLYDNNANDYWQDLESDFDEKVPSGQNSENYTLWRPIKFFSILKHSYGKEVKRLLCQGEQYDDFFSNSVGLQLYAVKRPLKVQAALTGFYEHRFSEKTGFKVTYTVNDYSNSNIGFGLTTSMGPVNIFATVDDIFNRFDIGEAQNVSFQLGLNIIFDNNE